MKNIIIKTIFALLLIIEFYPIESNSQTVNEIKACCIHNSDEEPVYGFSEELEFQQAEDRNIEYSTSENANEDIYDEVDTFENVNEDVDEDKFQGMQMRMSIMRMAFPMNSQKMQILKIIRAGLKDHFNGNIILSQKKIALYNC